MVACERRVLQPDIRVTMPVNSTDDTGRLRVHLEVHSVSNAFAIAGEIGDFSTIGEAWCDQSIWATAPLLA
jgi:hypothetical protein